MTRWLLVILAACGAPQDAGPDAHGEGPDGAKPDAPTSYDRVTLAFDELASGTVLATQYAAHATFASDPGCEISTSSSAGVAASQPNYIWTYYSCATGASASYFVDFAKPVRHVQFSLVGVNSSTKCATVRLVHTNGSISSSDAVGHGDYAVPVVIDLTDSSDVKRLEIVDVNDAYGLGVDDLAFDVAK
jgi:hypothetical protein